MPVTIQCTKVRVGASGFGASGSSTRIAIDFVPGGGGRPRQRRRDVIAFSCPKAGELTWRFVEAMPKASAAVDDVIRARAHYRCF
jgi:hypothetical protein